jgi:DNA-binding PadR family transcriptional regulator
MRYICLIMTPVAVPGPVEFQILLALAGEARHGYGIMQEVARQSAGRVAIGPGTLYGAIKRMRAAGWITEGPMPAGGNEDARRTSLFRITAAGRAAASEAASQMADLVSVAARLGLVGPKAAR